MKDRASFRNAQEAPFTCSLKRVFDLHAEDTITDEQVERVLSPVLRMIKEGRFEKPDNHRRQMRPLALATTAAVLTISIVSAQSNATSESLIYIEDAGLPMTNTAPVENMISCLAASETGGVGGIRLTLMRSDGTEIYGPALTGNDGICFFSNIPDGTYQLIAALPANGKNVNAGTWLVKDSKARLVYGGSDELLWEGVDVQICLT